MVRVCIDVDVDEKTKRFLELAGISLEEAIQRAVNRVIQNEFATLNTLPPQRAKPRKLKKLELLDREQEKINWEALIEYYASDPERAVREMEKLIENKKTRRDAEYAIRAIVEAMKKPENIIYHNKTCDLWVICHDNRIKLIKFFKRSAHMENYRGKNKTRESLKKWGCAELSKLVFKSIREFLYLKRQRREDMKVDVSVLLNELSSNGE